MNIEQQKLHEVEYEGPEETFQEISGNDLEYIKEQLEDFMRVPEKYLKDVRCGSLIKYITNTGKFRFGGVLIKNEYPLYYVLKNTSKNLTWSVNLSTNYIYLQNKKEFLKKKKEKDALYKLYQEGYVKILETPED